MDSKRRSSIAGGLVLILLGLAFLVPQLFPQLREWLSPRNAWPLIIVAVGAVMFFVALITWTPGMVVGACVLGGIGGLLYWQNATGNWASWAYAWTLIPGFAGVGTFLMYAMQGEWGNAFRRGGWSIVISAVLFCVFAAFLGGPNYLGAYWPLLLIALGVIMLAQSLWRSR